MRPTVSVIVPCRDHAEPLGRLIEALLAQDADPSSFEVLVVDDGSATPLPAPPSPERVRLLRQAPLGPAAARNTALRHARGHLVLFLNADAIAPRDLVRRHLEAHASSPTPTAILGRFDHLPAQRTPLMRLAERLGLWFDYDAAAAFVARGEALPWTFFWTGNLSAPLDAVRTAGGFEERFVRPIWEDLELGFRLARHALPLRFDPSIACAHDHPMDLDALLTRAEWMGHQWVTFARLHGGARFPILGGPDEPDDQLARALLSGLCHQHLRHAERRVELSRLLATLPHDAPTPSVSGPEAELLVGLNTVARMRGILGAITGHTPPELAEHAARFDAYDVVHTIADTTDLALTERFLDVLPRRARLVVAYESWLDPARLPADPRILALRLDRSADPVTRWRALLDASPSPAFVFLDGHPLPSRPEIEHLVAHLAVSPVIAATGLGERCGLPHTAAALVDSLPTHAIAIPRKGLAALGPAPQDGGPTTLLGRILARKMPLALVIPAGAAVG